MPSHTIEIAPNDKRSLSQLWGWLFRKYGAPVPVVRREERRLSIWAIMLILAVTKEWSNIINPIFSQTDAVRYYNFLQAGSWYKQYFLEQTMFRVMELVNPHTFAEYLFYSSAIPLFILLYSFYRLKYSKTDQFLLILFFSCSFYGVHFLITFQRQFYAIVLLVYAISSGKKSLIARFASLFSHLYAFVLHLFWEFRRLSTRTIVLITVPLIPIVFIVMEHAVSRTFDQYSMGGEARGDVLAVKEGLTLIFAAIILWSLKPGRNLVRSTTIAYVLFCLPALAWNTYAGVFVRLDDYFFPFLIAMWPTCLSDNHRLLFRCTIIASTALGFVLWMLMNFTFLTMGT
jgi:hypothetical protein